MVRIYFWFFLFSKINLFLLFLRDVGFGIEKGNTWTWDQVDNRTEVLKCFNLFYSNIILQVNKYFFLFSSLQKMIKFHKQVLALLWKFLISIFTFVKILIQPKLLFLYYSSFKIQRKINLYIL